MQSGRPYTSNASNGGELNIIFGGMSKAGVDCSGFVFLTYRDRLGVELPRTTLHQLKTGSLVEPNELLAGDLVFFLTDGKTRHVGIYLNDDQFVHASKSKGVVVSSLSNNYWRETFWQARRINR
jgi:cell wall-associated NlpC family hydrolase